MICPAGGYVAPSAAGRPLPPVIRLTTMNPVRPSAAGCALGAGLPPLDGDGLLGRSPTVAEGGGVHRPGVPSSANRATAGDSSSSPLPTAAPGLPLRKAAQAIVTAEPATAQAASTSIGTPAPLPLK